MWKVEKSGEKYQKWKNVGKSLKSGKILKIFEKYFLPRKIKNGKFWKNLLEFVESGKIW